MIRVSVGLSDLCLYAPEPRINLATLVARRLAENPDLEKHLARALNSTGQVSMRFPEVWEDPITMAAEALRTLLGRRTPEEIDGLRFLTLGTETSVDMAKSGSNYVLGALTKAGFKLPSRLASFQVQHACAGGSLAALTTAGYLQSAGRDSDSSLVLTSDVARYEAPSTAEVTQGAGAAALWLTRNPRLLEFDLETAGFFSKDVDDFFRPLGSTIAKVRGGFSLACYNESLVEAFADHCDRADVDPARELEDVDVFCLHVPYAKLPAGAMERLLNLHLGHTQDQAREFLDQRGFFASLEPATKIGNLYTGSLWLSLAWSLKERFSKLGSEIVGKKVLMASYGSGNTMAVWTCRVAQGAAEVLNRWNLDQLMNDGEVPWETYLEWLTVEKNPVTYPELLTTHPVPAGRFHLARLRENGYRDYDVS